MQKYVEGCLEVARLLDRTNNSSKSLILRSECYSTSKFKEEIRSAVQPQASSIDRGEIFWKKRSGEGPTNEEKGQCFKIRQCRRE